MAGSQTDIKPQRETKVLALGLPRTGSASMAEALRILGYKDVHHGVDAFESPQDWSFLSRAADASFPTLPTYTGKPLTRDEWDELFGPYEAITDIAAMFATQLLKAYPEAKVVLMMRDFDKWNASVEAVMRLVFSFRVQLGLTYLAALGGSALGQASTKILLGFFEGRSADEALQNTRMVYDRHHRQVRERVPAGRLLEYRMGSGWEPLCSFLDKPVPDGEFPWVNEAQAFRMRVLHKVRRNLVAAAMVLVPWVVGAVAVGVGGWMVMQRLRLV